MNDSPIPSTISDQDIVFECPGCGYSMAIDRRGAGLTITCPSCDKPVRVPDPSGESTDQPITGGLQEALESSEHKLSELATNLTELTGQRRELEAMRKEQSARIQKLRTEFLAIQSALDRIAFILEDGPE